MLKAIIIDDERAGIKAVKMLAEQHAARVKIIADAQQADKGMELIRDHKPDLVFLDINMPGMDGFELLQQFPSRDFKVVFTTAHKEYGIQAVKVGAFDYLLKPIAESDFSQLIEKLASTPAENAVPKQEPHLFLDIKTRNGVIYIKQKEIIRLEAFGSYTEIHMDDGHKEVASKGIGEFDHRLDPSLFYRCHKSHIINLHKVLRFFHTDGFYVEMHGGTKVDIARSSKEDLLKRLSML